MAEVKKITRRMRAIQQGQCSHYVLREPGAEFDHTFDPKQPPSWCEEIKAEKETPQKGAAK